MKVTALAEALIGSRRSDGAVSLQDLQSRLSRAGLEELQRAVVSLARRVNRPQQNRPVAEKYPWF
jgi:hypothetical protein